MGKAISKRIAQLAAKTGRTLLLITACVSLLQLPIPMAHEHAAFASSMALAEHLDRHHTADENGEDWHWHLVLPCDLCADGRARGEGEGPSDGSTTSLAGYGLTEAVTTCDRECNALSFFSASVAVGAGTVPSLPPISLADLAQRHAVAQQNSPAFHVRAVLQIIRC